MYKEAKTLTEDIEHFGVGGEEKAVTFDHVYRELNVEADRLANEAMDGKRSWIECRK